MSYPQEVFHASKFSNNDRQSLQVYRVMWPSSFYFLWHNLGVFFYHNKLLREHSLELVILNAKTDLSSEETVKEFLSHVRNLNISNRDAFFYILTIITGIGGGMMLYGLKKWHQEIQPQQDELLNLQIEKMKLEIIELENKVKAKEVE